MKLGTNLASINDMRTEQPFLNIIKTCGGWQTYHLGADTGESVALYQNYLDANGFPTNIAPGGGLNFTEVGLTVLLDLSPTFYLPGNYVFLYDGTGTFTFSNDFSATPVSSVPGRIVIPVATPTDTGSIIKCISTGAPPNHAHNWQLVYSPDSTGAVIGKREALLNSGEIFNPDLIAKISSFDTLRFMDWMGTTRNFQKNWTDRPIPGWFSYCDSRTNSTINGNYANPHFGGMCDGVPAEIMFALCNKIGAHAWFCMPPLATDDYVTQFATLAHASMNRPLKVYVEYANELWNQKLGGASGTMTKSVVQQVSDLCLAAFPYFVGTSDFQKNSQYSALRSIQVGKLWKTAWGVDSGRVVSMFGGWAGNSSYNSTYLPFTDPGPNGDGVTGPFRWTGTVAQNVDKLSVAPYWGYGFVNLTETMVFTEIFSGGMVDPAVITDSDPLGMLHQAKAFVTTCKAQAVANGVGLILYEGTFQIAAGSNPAVINLLTSAQRNRLMFDAMKTYLDNCQSQGAELLCQYVDISPAGQPPGNAFFWGCWEDVNQVRSMRGDAALQFTTPNRRGTNLVGGF